MTGRSGLDPRLTPARADLAAAYLDGIVLADRYAVGTPCIIVNDVADIRRLPRPDAPLETQALHGEPVVLYDEDENGWGWVQLGFDGYVGYVAMQALAPQRSEATHHVCVNRTFVYPAADMKQPVMAALPRGARIVVADIVGSFARLNPSGFVVFSHIAPMPIASLAKPDAFVRVAECLLQTPYLWGGKTPLGIDCSGLVQLALAQTGIAAPRDADLQESIVGDALDLERLLPQNLTGLRRGDLVFWKGHVGIMRDERTLLHANAHHMLVASEPIQQAHDRIIAATQATITSVRRIAQT